MKINRKDLRQAVTDALAEHKARYDRAHAEWQTLVERHRTEWIEENAARWADAAKAIARKVKAGQPITDGDLPRDRRGYGSRATYDTPHHLDGRSRPHDIYVAPHELTALGKALDVITDDEITHTALRSLGITGATLRDAISQLGRATAQGAAKAS